MVVDLQTNRSKMMILLTSKSSLARKLMGTHITFIFERLFHHIFEAFKPILHGSWGFKSGREKGFSDHFFGQKIVGAICASRRLWGWWALNPLVPLSLLLQSGRHCPIWTRRWSPFPVSNDDGDEWEMKWATKKEKKTPTFQYIGCSIGILIVVYYNPYTLR